MKKIDISKIRGKWESWGGDNKPTSGGDDTIQSIQMVAETVNEIIDTLPGSDLIPRNKVEQMLRVLYSGYGDSSLEIALRELKEI